MSERYETDTGGGCLHSTVVENSLHQLRQIGCRKPQPPPPPQPQPSPSPQNSTYNNLHHSSHSTITTTESHIKSSKQLFDTNMMHGASEIYNFPSDGEIFCFPPRVLASHHTSEEASSSRVIGQGVLKNGGMSNSMWKPYANPQLQGKTPCYEGGQHNYTGPVYLGGDMFHQPSNNVVQPNPKHAVEIPMQASSLYENNAIPIVATELGNSQGNMWVNRTNELVLLPSYADHYLPPPYGVPNWPNNKNSHGHGALQDTYHQEPFVHEKVGNDFRPQHLSTNSGGHEGSGALSLSLTPHQPQHTIDAMPNRTSVFQISAEDVKSRSDDLVSKNGSEDGSYSRQAGQSFNGKTIDLLMNSGPLPACTGYSSILKNSKYLKPAQQLLQEFCNLAGKGQTCSYNVSKEVGGSSEQLCFDKSSQDNHAVANSSVNVKDEESTVNTCSASSSMVMVSRMPNEDSDQQQYSCDRYEMQKMQSKLASLLEELNKRYRLYHQTMQMIMSSFESVSGLGAAVPYTTLALKRMSKHFRCLRNSISNQLKSIAKTLGDDSSLAELYRGNTSKTSFVNHSLRTQRPLHPLGLIEQHPWRPQRGLPERSVAVLRAWLFEHFLYPYPTDAEKHMLARQTGLTRSQVSNWFINARVRLWKPMVEEMWMLEQKEIADMDSKEGKWKGIDNRDIMKSPPMGKHIAKHGKAILEGFPELHSIGGSSKVNHGVSGSKDSSENIDTRMSTHVVGTHFLQGQEMDRSTDSDVNSSRNFCQEQYQFPYPINGSVGISRRYDEMNGFLAYGQSPKRLRQQGFESTIDLSSYMTGKYTPESLATARQVGNTNVSLTLGLQHGSGPEKYSSAIFLPGDGDSLQGCTQQFQIHGVNEAHDQNFGGSFNPQDLQFRKNLVGSQLLH